MDSLNALKNPKLQRAKSSFMSISSEFSRLPFTLTTYLLAGVEYIADAI
jgi:hypothetical protein